MGDVKVTRKSAGRPFTGKDDPRANFKGRPKGCPNKVTRTTKENIERVFEALGGWEGMRKWVESSRQNATIFYSEIYPKLLPLDVNHKGDLNLTMKFEYGNGKGE